MRLRNIPGADDAILNSEYCIKNPEEQKGHWQDCFDKVQPLHIEIGMGKAVLSWIRLPCTRTLITSASSVTPAYFYALCRKWSRIRFLILSLSAWTLPMLQRFSPKTKWPYLLKTSPIHGQKTAMRRDVLLRDNFLPVMTRFWKKRDTLNLKLIIRIFSPSLWRKCRKPDGN